MYKSVVARLAGLIISSLLIGSLGGCGEGSSAGTPTAEAAPAALDQGGEAQQGPADVLAKRPGILLPEDVVATVDGEPITVDTIRRNMADRYLDHWRQLDAALHRVRMQALADLAKERGAQRIVSFLPGVERQQVPEQPDNKRVLGAGEGAVVNMVIYQDYQCPYCNRHEGTVERLRQQYGDELRVEYRDFPLGMHRQARLASIAARCAAEQGKFEPYHRALFDNARALNRKLILDLAQREGLDTSSFEACLENPEVAKKVNKDVLEGRSLGVSGTPGTFINGISVSGAAPQEELAALIEGELADNVETVTGTAAREALDQGIAGELEGQPVTIAELDEKAGAAALSSLSRLKSEIYPVLLKYSDLLILEKLKPKHDIQIKLH